MSYLKKSKEIRFLIKLLFGKNVSLKYGLVNILGNKGIRYSSSSLFAWSVIIGSCKWI